MPKKLSKEQLDKSRFWFLEPKVESGINYALKELQDDNMIEFLSTIASIDRDIEHHIMIRCANAENENIRIDCVNKANNIKSKAINKLGEGLVDKCGGKLNYLIEEET